MQDLDFVTHSLGLQLPTTDPQEVVELIYMILNSSMVHRVRENEFWFYLSLDPEALMLIHGGTGDSFKWKLGFLQYLQSVNLGTWVQTHLNHLQELCLFHNLTIPT